MIKVKNNSKHLYSHSVKETNKDGKVTIKDYFLQPQGVLDVPEEVAKIWFKTNDIVEFVEPEEAKAKEKKIQKEKEALEKENASLKAKITALEEAKAKEKKEKKEK